MVFAALKRNDTRCVTVTKSFQGISFDVADDVCVASTCVTGSSMMPIQHLPAVGPAGVGRRCEDAYHCTIWVSRQTKGLQMSPCRTANFSSWAMTSSDVIRRELADTHGFHFDPLPAFPPTHVRFPPIVPFGSIVFLRRESARRVGDLTVDHVSHFRPRWKHSSPAWRYSRCISASKSLGYGHTSTRPCLIS